MRYVFAIAGVVLVSYLFTGVTQVRPGERAVVRRFGRVADVAEPGLYVGLPWGMDRVDRVPADLVRRVPVGFQAELSDDGLTTPPGQLLTGDHNLVNVGLVIDYAVQQDSADPQQVKENVVDYVLQAERLDTLVARAAEAVIAEWVAGRTVDDVLIRGKRDLPEWVQQETQKRIAEYQLGIRIQAASVAHLLPPERVKYAFDAVTKAQTAMHTTINRAHEQEARMMRDTEISRLRMDREAQADVNSTLRAAKTDAETFEKRRQAYHELRKQNPNMLAAIWWDEMGRVFARMKENGRIDLLDSHLAGDGLDITTFVPNSNRNKR